MACSRSRFFTHWIPRFWKLRPPRASVPLSPEEHGPSCLAHSARSPPPTRQVSTSCLSPLNGPQPCHRESHSLLWLTRPCALAPGPSGSPCRLPTLCHRGFFPFSKHMKLIPTSKAFAPVHSAGRVPSVLLCFPTFRSYLREALLTSQSKEMGPAPSPPPPRALLPNYYCFTSITEMVTP